MRGYYSVNVRRAFASFLGFRTMSSGKASLAITVCRATHFDLKTESCQLLAGSSEAASLKDSANPAETRFSQISSACQDAAGNLVIADRNNQALRLLST